MATRFLVEEGSLLLVNGGALLVEADVATIAFRTVGVASA